MPQEVKASKHDKHIKQIESDISNEPEPYQPEPFSYPGHGHINTIKREHHVTKLSRSTSHQDTLAKASIDATKHDHSILSQHLGQVTTASNVIRRSKTPPPFSKRSRTEQADSLNKSQPSGDISKQAAAVMSMTMPSIDQDVVDDSVESELPIPSNDLPNSIVLHEGLLKKQLASNVYQRIYIRIIESPLSIYEYEYLMNVPKLITIHSIDNHSGWIFAHNRNNLSILIKSNSTNMVLLCSDAEQHKAFRNALMRVQELIRDETPSQEQHQPIVQSNDQSNNLSIDQSNTQPAEQSVGQLNSQPVTVVLDNNEPTPDNSADEMINAPVVIIDDTSTVHQNDLHTIQDVPKLSPALIAQPTIDHTVKPVEQLSFVLSSSAPVRSISSPLTSSLMSSSSFSNTTQANLIAINPTKQSLVPSTNQPINQSPNFRPAPRSASLSESDLAELVMQPVARPLSAQRKGSSEQNIQQNAVVVSEEERLRAAAVKDRMYRKLFNLSDSECLMSDYSCAVQRSILLHGRMYISEHWLCFFSSIFNHKTMIKVAIDDILMVQSAKVALVFDNSLKLYVQTGPLPIPLPARKSSDSSRTRVRKLSEPNMSTGNKESSYSMPLAAGDSFDRSPALSDTSLSAPPSPKGFTLGGATTNNASYSLSLEQIAHLISVGHPNITTHFFASFLTRDHALNLLESLLSRRHGRSGFTSLSSLTSIAPAEAPKSYSPSQSSRSIVSHNAVSSPSSTSSSSHLFASVPTDENDADNVIIPLSENDQSSKSDTSTTLQWSDAKIPEHDEPDESVKSAVADALATNGSGVSALPTIPAFSSLRPSTVEFASDVTPPVVTDFNDAIDDIFVDTVFANMNAALMFHLFLSDRAPFNLAELCASNKPSESEYAMGSWSATGASSSDVSTLGEAVRLVSCKMNIGPSPVGASITRVHRTQRWTTQSSFEGKPAQRLDIVSLTPDLAFGDCIVVIERWYLIEQDNSLRLRISGGVRFKQKPWKMKPFISLIQQRARDDGTKGAQAFKTFAEASVQKTPIVEAVRSACVSIQHLSPLEKILVGTHESNDQCIVPDSALHTDAVSDHQPSAPQSVAIRSPITNTFKPTQANESSKDLFLQNPAEFVLREWNHLHLSDQLCASVMVVLMTILLVWPGFAWSSWLVLVVIFACVIMLLAKLSWSCRHVMNELSEVKSELGTVQQLLLELKVRYDEDREERRHNVLHIDAHHFD